MLCSDTSHVVERDDNYDLVRWIDARSNKAGWAASDGFAGNTNRGVRIFRSEDFVSFRCGRIEGLHGRCAFSFSVAGIFEDEDGIVLGKGRESVTSARSLSCVAVKHEPNVFRRRDLAGVTDHLILVTPLREPVCIFVMSWEVEELSLDASHAESDSNNGADE